MPGTTFNYNGAIIQTYTVAVTGTYDITAFGAQGGQGGNPLGATGGLGAEIGGEFSLTQGEVLQIVVGGAGAAGGSGGGGGGGSAFNNNLAAFHGDAGQAGTSGTNGHYGGGAGGTGGGGGAGGTYGGGGGGFSGGNGGGGYSNPTPSTNGSGQGSGYGGGGGSYGSGGFGGGGGGGYDGGGGGGGFSGGGGGGYGGFGKYGGGGGGGSLDTGTPLLAVAGENAGNGLITIDPACFLRGTHIRTPTGEVVVEDLKIGDLVVTLSGQHRPLRWIGSGRTLVTPGNRDRASPIVIIRHALKEWVPRRDLYITRGHSLYLDGVLIPIEELINHRSIAWVTEARVVEYYHLELDSHDVVLAEGAAAETYRDDDNSASFHNVATRLAAPPAPPYAPVLHDHPTVRRIWHKLSERAGRPDLTLTSDPDLHLLADGVRLDAESFEQSVWRFRMPGRVTDLRIASRSAIPSMLGIAQDQRRLGVALRRIVVAEPERRLELDWDDTRLIAGFHGPEPAERHRWTNGEATLPRALSLRAGAMVELHVNALIPYSVATDSLPAEATRAAA